jgi:hypothetical protein
MILHYLIVTYLALTTLRITRSIARHNICLYCKQVQVGVLIRTGVGGLYLPLKESLPLILSWGHVHVHVYRSFYFEFRYPIVYLEKQQSVCVLPSMIPSLHLPDLLKRQAAKSKTEIGGNMNLGRDPRHARSTTQRLTESRTVSTSNVNAIQTQLSNQNRKKTLIDAAPNTLILLLLFPQLLQFRQNFR